MDYLYWLSIVSAICSILGLVISLFVSNFIKSPKLKRLVIGFILFVITFISGLVAHISSENERIKNIHRQAYSIYEDYNPFYSKKAFIQEALTFLEENQDRYPDSYKRAVQIYSDMKNSDGQYDYEPAIEIYGIIEGIAKLNGDKKRH